jgi:hypothetical protein
VREIERGNALTEAEGVGILTGGGGGSQLAGDSGAVHAIVSLSAQASSVA